MAGVWAYVCHNYDGTHSVAVAASTLTEAARKMSSSPYHMRTFGWNKTIHLTTVIDDPEHIYRRKIGDRMAPYERWKPVP